MDSRKPHGARICSRTCRQQITSAETAAEGEYIAATNRTRPKKSIARHAGSYPIPRLSPAVQSSNKKLPSPQPTSMTVLRWSSYVSINRWISELQYERNTGEWYSELSYARSYLTSDRSKAALKIMPQEGQNARAISALLMLSAWSGEAQRTEHSVGTQIEANRSVRLDSQTGQAWVIESLRCLLRIVIPSFTGHSFTSRA